MSQQGFKAAVAKIYQQAPITRVQLVLEAPHTFSSCRSVPCVESERWRPDPDGTITLGIHVWRTRGEATLIKIFAHDCDDSCLELYIKAPDLIGFGADDKRTRGEYLEPVLDAWQRWLSNVAVVSVVDLLALGLEWA